MDANRTIIRAGVSILLVIAFLGSVAFAQGSFSRILSFQGRLCDTSGKPLPDGPYAVRFALYDASTVGNLMWQETQGVTQVGGVFTVYLGSVTAFPPTIFNNGDLWLGITVGADPEMPARVQLTPSPWALYATEATHAQTTESATQAVNSDKVDGIHAETTPTGKRLLALDIDAKFPLSTIPQGAGSTLDSDTVDTFHANSTPISNKLLTLDATAKWPLATIPQGSGSNLDADKIDTFHAGSTAQANRLLTLDGSAKWPIATIPQGSGSTLNADQVDTLHASATPTANYLLPLDATGKFPATVIPPDADWAISGSNIYRLAGLAGIGVDPPLYPLHVVSGSTRSIYSETTSSSGIGVYGINSSASGDSPGIYGQHAVTDFYGIGVKGVGGYKGVDGYVEATGDHGYFGVYGRVSGGSGQNHGVYGYASGAGANYGVYGYATGGTTNYAGYFSGDVRATGAITAGNSSYDGTTVYASNYGQSRGQATLQAHNYQPNMGMAAYFTNVGSYATAHIECGGTGEVLWLQRPNSDNAFIVCSNNDLGRRVFQVNADGWTQVAVLEITGGADLSEQFNITEANTKPEPGMVVSVDPVNAGNLVVSSSAYDRTVIGIISGAGGVKPGMLMGQTDTIATGDHPVALTGRVWVWCDASNGSIELGDLLTTSDVPGHAMAATDYDKAKGAIIGKAMTTLKEGRGLVLVVVNLQ